MSRAQKIRTKGLQALGLLLGLVLTGCGAGEPEVETINRSPENTSTTLASYGEYNWVGTWSKFSSQNGTGPNSGEAYGYFNFSDLPTQPAEKKYWIFLKGNFCAPTDAYRYFTTAGYEDRGTTITIDSNGDYVVSSGGRYIFMVDQPGQLGPAGDNFSLDVVDDNTLSGIYRIGGNYCDSVLRDAGNITLHPVGTNNNSNDNSSNTDTGGNTGNSSSAPSAPSGVNVTSGDGQVTVNWDAVSGATSYNLYMATQNGVTKSNYSSLPGSMKHAGVTAPFTHADLTNGTTYYFVVTAVNADGESIESYQVSATPTATIEVSGNDLVWKFAWKSVDPLLLPGNNFSMSDVIWTGSQYVITGVSGNKGVILTSSDGKTWAPHILGTDVGFSSITWSGSQFVGVGPRGMILTSSDGVTWVTQASGTLNDLMAVVWTGSQYVAVGRGGTILTSPDGATWTSRLSHTTSDLFAVAWSGSQYVVVGGRGTILTSFDSVLWLVRSSPVSNTSVGLFGIIWAGAQYVAVGSVGTILTSPDGATWTSRTSWTKASLVDITWTGNQYLVVGETTMLTSPDGINWTLRDFGSGSYYDNYSHFVAVAWNGNQYLVGQKDDVVMTSTNGTSWEWRRLLTGGNGAISISSVAWSGSQYVAVGKTLGAFGAPEQKLLTSTNGETWTTYSSPVYFTSPITWAGDKFVAFSSLDVYTSSDGLIWELHKQRNSITKINAVIWAGNQLVAVGANGVILTSPDGMTWTSQQSPVSGAIVNLSGIAWSGSQYVVVGSDGIILTSPDGIIWELYASGTNNSLGAIVWSGSQFVAVGQGGTVLTSPDSVTWTARNSGSSASLTSITWSGSQYAIVGAGGVIFTSLDGINWTSCISETDQGLIEVIWGGDRFIAVGDQGILWSR